jgi:hypothetical protein
MKTDKQIFDDYDKMMARKPRVLHLTLKKKWFDMIESGEKKEEYREVKDYWMKRLAGIKGCGTGYNFTLLLGVKCIHYDHIVFKNGYAKDAPTITVECRGIKVDSGKTKWGAPSANARVFVIKLGKQILPSTI